MRSSTHTRFCNLLAAPTALAVTMKAVGCFGSLTVSFESGMVLLLPRASCPGAACTMQFVQTQMYSCGRACSLFERVHSTASRL